MTLHVNLVFWKSCVISRNFCLTKNYFNLIIGPPGFSNAAQTLTSNKFNYDIPMEELLNDSDDDDLDSETEILIWIKDFLHNELGKSGVNVPMLLMNNIRSLGSDELVLQVSLL